MVQGTTFYLVTDYLAERKRIVAADLASPARQDWTEVVGEAPDTLLSAHHFGGQLVCHYLRDAHSVLRSSTSMALRAARSRCPASSRSAEDRATIRSPAGPPAT